ncbi:dimethylallyltranstransferase / geranyltranstransferase [Natronococcus sp. A-GB1]|uniref:dimethylallyltranstransferase / geranyltranstransferase n=1 Tax=Natronococcus sp. A-GB1 TaxID=3037648 RepID=UPI00241FADA8|nr:dimethylallyltranstransferase / geranyltranstransferase [Natronococcus sp. A-GB1]MDG5758104.1 dimethylallyltranstransferase / geranyltranstransferase [Natronococcus sp. A-GB1]
MRRTIARRRAAIEDALRTHLPEAGAFDRSPEELLELGRPRIRGQVFLAMADGLGDERPLEELVPIAASLELVSLQVRLHRSAAEYGRRTGHRPTDDVLLGDLLESKAFALTARFDAEPALVERCLETLAEATRAVQEGEASLASEPQSAVLETDAVRRIGSLTGCAVELAALLTDVEPRRELAQHGSALGYCVRSRRSGNGVSTDRRRCPPDRSQWIEPIVECCPPDSKAAVRTQLSAVLEASIDRESADPIA